jgi:hypothetical protein
MENRRKPVNPAPAASPTKAKPDDFEPPLSSDGPKKGDSLASPPSSYDCGTTPAAPRR